jgi:hypothetical protein
LLPDWEWEAYEKEGEGIYFGRVKSPNTYGRWEYGYFTDDQLQEAGAYRTDLDPDDNDPLFPDGGRLDISELKLYETEVDALLDADGGGL